MAAGYRHRRLGWVSAPDGATGAAALRRRREALAPLECADRRRAIPAGARFTRRHRCAAGRQVVVCRACAPFADLAGSERRR
jgi:hypothetical protein